MSKPATRIKSAARARIADAREAAEAMARIAAIRADIAAQRQAFDTMVAELRRKLDAPVATLEAEERALADDVRDWAEFNRRKLTNDGRRKSVAVGPGRVGWQKGKARVEIEDGSEERIVGALRASNLHQFLRVKESVDRNAMLKEPALAETVAGVTIVPASESFYLEIVSKP